MQILHHLVHEVAGLLGQIYIDRLAGVSFLELCNSADDHGNHNCQDDDRDEQLEQRKSALAALSNSCKPSNRFHDYDPPMPRTVTGTA